MEETGSKASVRSRDGIQGNVLLYIGFYNNANHNIVCVHDIDFWTCSDGIRSSRLGGGSFPPKSFSKGSPLGKSKRYCRAMQSRTRNKKPHLRHLCSKSRRRGLL